MDGHTHTPHVDEHIIYAYMLYCFSVQNTLKEEIQLYRSYLAEAKREERQREQELDSLLSAEVEKQWAKRTQQWRKEREARRKLMDDVLKTRRQQIKEKCKLC